MKTLQKAQMRCFYMQLEGSGEGTAAVASSQNESMDLFGDYFSQESPRGNQVRASIRAVLRGQTFEPNVEYSQPQ